MEAQAKQKNIRMPARKMRRIINQVRGKSVQDAVNILKFMPYFAARVVEQNIKSAAANASEKWGVLSEKLIVSEVYADEGPTYKRARPRAQGRIYKIHKCTSHLTVKVKVNEELKEKLGKKQKSQKVKEQTKKEIETKEKEVEVITEEKQEVTSKAEAPTETTIIETETQQQEEEIKEENPETIDESQRETEQASEENNNNEDESNKQ